jgi:hypothetical protein
MTTENNKIIAEFMGMKPINKNESNGIWNCTIKTHGFNIVQHLSFHSDWNWLMEVVKKITTLEEFQYNYEFNQLFWEVFNQLDIDEVYIQVFLFIEWYNKNKS